MRIADRRHRAAPLPDGVIAMYARYGAARYAAFGGIKVFLEHDPDPLTERQLLSLTPKPSLFVYQ